MLIHEAELNENVNITYDFEALNELFQNLSTLHNDVKMVISEQAKSIHFFLYAPDIQKQERVTRAVESSFHHELAVQKPILFEIDIVKSSIKGIQDATHNEIIFDANGLNHFKLSLRAMANDEQTTVEINSNGFSTIILSFENSGEILVYGTDGITKRNLQIDDKKLFILKHVINKANSNLEIAVTNTFFDTKDELDFSIQQIFKTDNKSHYVTFDENGVVLNEEESFINTDRTTYDFVKQEADKSNSSNLILDLGNSKMLVMDASNGETKNIFRTREFIDSPAVFKSIFNKELKSLHDLELDIYTNKKELDNYVSFALENYTNIKAILNIKSLLMMGSYVSITLRDPLINRNPQFDDVDTIKLAEFYLVQKLLTTLIVDYNIMNSKNNKSNFKNFFAKINIITETIWLDREKLLLTDALSNIFKNLVNKDVQIKSISEMESSAKFVLSSINKNNVLYKFDNNRWTPFILESIESDSLLLNIDIGWGSLQIQEYKYKDNSLRDNNRYYYKSGGKKSGSYSFFKELHKRFSKIVSKVDGNLVVNKSLSFEEDIIDTLFKKDVLISSLLDDNNNEVLDTEVQDFVKKVIPRIEDNGDDVETIAMKFKIAMASTLREFFNTIISFVEDFEGVIHLCGRFNQSISLAKIISQANEKIILIRAVNLATVNSIGAASKNQVVLNIKPKYVIKIGEHFQELNENDTLVLTYKTSYLTLRYKNQELNDIAYINSVIDNANGYLIMRTYTHDINDATCFVPHISISKADVKDCSFTIASLYDTPVEGIEILPSAEIRR